jgi:hypothetical protein
MVTAVIDFQQLHLIFWGVDPLGPKLLVTPPPIVTNKVGLALGCRRRQRWPTIGSSRRFTLSLSFGDFQLICFC